MDFYAARYRANRRKRAKLPANPQAVPYPATAPHGVRPLGTQGWAARFDWKAGYWAEGRGDVDLARRSVGACGLFLRRVVVNAFFLDCGRQAL